MRIREAINGGIQQPCVFLILNCSKRRLFRTNNSKNVLDNYRRRMREMNETEPQRPQTAGVTGLHDPCPVYEAEECYL